MNRHYADDYNDTIKLRQRDIGDIIQKSNETGCKYYMQISLAERRVWVGFKEPFESGIDRLHALYYKVKTADDDINVCLGLWDGKPSSDTIERQLWSINNSPEPAIHQQDIYDLLKFGRESGYLELVLPNYVSKSRFIDNVDFDIT